MAGPTIVTSILGRRFGLSKNGYMVAEDHNVVAATTASTLTAAGINTLSSATATYTLPAPIPGFTKRIVCTSTSTNVRTITLAAGNLVTTAGTSFISLTMQGGGQFMTVLGISTSQWLLTATNSSAAPTT